MSFIGTDPRIQEAAVQSSPSGVLVCDDSGVILYANSRAQSIFGYTAEELIDARIEALLPEASRAVDAEKRAHFWDHLQSRRNSGRELRGVKRDGSEVPVEVDLMFANDDGPRLMVVSVVDLTERLQRERIVREAAEREVAFERLVSNLAGLFISVDPSRLEEAVVEGQRQIAQALDIDRCGFWQFTEDGEALVPTYSWVRPGLQPVAPAESVTKQFPWFLSKIRAGEVVWFEKLDDVPSAFDRESLRQYGAKSSAIIPMYVDGQVLGALSLTAVRREREWNPDVLERLRQLGAVIAQMLTRRKGQAQLERAYEEIRKLRDQLASENVQLHHEVRSLKIPRAIAAESDSVRAALAQVESVAPTDSTVLLLGETGSGKEMFAEAIHELSKRREHPMVRVNCAAIPTALMESELFGRERGAYTGALSREIGRFELAQGTTIFLDEVGDLSLEAQAKLLRVLQDKTLERLGSVRPIKVDVRVIAATNLDLKKAVAERTFREDLFYRLNVFPITVPPLRDRSEDIPILVWAFIDEFSKAFKKPIESISRESLMTLQRHSWPGNVRELRNVIERSVIVAKSPRLVIELPQEGAVRTSERMTLSEVEADHIREVMQQVGWRVRGPGGAAELLGVKPTTLDSRMAKLGVRRPKR